VLWKAVQEAKAQGMERLDLGRSDRDNEGLITFKDRWGAEKSELIYLRYSRSRAAQTTHRRRSRALRQAFARMPDSMLVAAGKLLYRHIG
jgi:lipid II:glycine glycyltransferase (peptidoglycan interpeptide bridge formation enzyme)